MFSPLKVLGHKTSHLNRQVTDQGQKVMGKYVESEEFLQRETVFFFLEGQESVGIKGAWQTKSGENENEEYSTKKS